MAEQDREDLVPSVLNDLIDVDGEPADGDTLTYSDGAWRPVRAKPSQVFNGNCGVISPGDYINPLLTVNTDSMYDTPPADWTIGAEAALFGYWNVGEYVRCQRTGIYCVTGSYRITGAAADATAGRSFDFSVYPDVDNGNAGPHYYTRQARQVTLVSGQNVQHVFEHSYTGYFEQGNSMRQQGLYNGVGVAAPSQALFWLSIQRLM